MKKVKPVAPLLALLQTNKPSHELVIESVPASVSIGSDRYHIVSIRLQDGEVVARYQIPGQWTKQEVSILAQEIRGIGWQLLEDELYEGRPKDNHLIDEICERFCEWRQNNA